MSEPATPRPVIRVDKWLWQARFFKTRTLAATVVAAGKLRLNGTAITKPARMVGQGDVLTFAQGEDVRVIKVIANGDRRGPAPEAQTLYEDLAPIVPRTPEEKAQDSAAENPRFEGKGRPTRRDRRNRQSEGIPGQPSWLE